jgi:hypothetical protein
MTRLAILTPSPRRRVLDTGTDAPLDRITHIMAELALDDDQWDTLVGHLDRVRVPQLVRREPPADAGWCCRVVELFACGGGFPAAAGGRSVDDAEQSSDGKLGSSLEPWLQLIPSPAVHPDLAAFAALPVPDEHGAAWAVKVRFGKVECLADPEPGAPQHHDEAG